MKGIVLAGGSGTRLHPLTQSVSKQLLPVYDKPMIYYPISVLMLAGIRDILVITTPHDQEQFTRLLGDGSQWGVSLTFAAQPSPDGLAQAFLIGADCGFLDEGDGAALVLGDNIFFGHGIGGQLADSARQVTEENGCTLFGYRVGDPERYGVAVLDADGRVVDIEEKPQKPRSNLAVTGLYFYDGQVVARARALKPSARGELEITDLNRVYLEQGEARLVDLGRGTAWLDTGTQDALLEAGQFVQVLQHRQGITIACLEEVAMRRGFITAHEALQRGEDMGKSNYAQYLRRVASQYLEDGGLMAEVETMVVEPTAIDGLLRITAKTVTDERGTVREFFRASAYAEHGVPVPPQWSQVNLTRTLRGGVRGLHGENADKLIGLSAGEAFGAWLDARPGSPTHGNVVTTDLRVGTQMFVPAGVCNGFQAVTDCEYLYCFGTEWTPGMAGVAVNPNDPELDIAWPLTGDDALVSVKDAAAPMFSEL